MRLSLLITILAMTGCPGPTPVVPTGDPNDRDGDGFTQAFDCDDGNADINPDAEDVVDASGVDDNCDGVDGVDGDEDGFASVESGGDDCDDTSNGINVDAIDIGWNEVDEDCNGSDRHDWSDVGLGQFVSCGTKSTGEFLCWGSDENGEITDAPTTGEISSVHGSAGYLCAIQDGSVVCWGDDENGMVSGAPAGTSYVKVTTSALTACALTNLGEAVCWGDDTNGQISFVPVAELNDVVIGATHACAVFDIGGPLNATCWGVDLLPEDIPFPQGPFRQLASGASHVCGILQDSTLKCWGGANSFGQTSPANRKGPYTDLSASGDHACGILSASRIECWGRNNFGQLDAPTFSAVNVETGYSHSCALNGQGLLFCWGDNTSGQTDIP